MANATKLALLWLFFIVAVAPAHAFNTESTNSSSLSAIEDTSKLFSKPFPLQNSQDPLDAQIALKISYWCSERQLDPLLVWAVIDAESTGNPKARSPAGAMGLMQIMPFHFAPHEDPYDIDTNIERGTAVLARYLDELGSIKLALAAYNAGIGAVYQYGGIPPYEETTRYVQNIMSRYMQLLEMAAHKN
jgi:soluble lytic murein transglycosylase-like protein